MDQNPLIIPLTKNIPVKSKENSPLSRKSPRSSVTKNLQIMNQNYLKNNKSKSNKIYISVKYLIKIDVKPQKSTSPHKCSSPTCRRSSEMFSSAGFSSHIQNLQLKACPLIPTIDKKREDFYKEFIELLKYYDNSQPETEFNDPRDFLIWKLANKIKEISEKNKENSNSLDDKTKENELILKECLELKNLLEKEKIKNSKFQLDLENNIEHKKKKKNSEEQQIQSDLLKSLEREKNINEEKEFLKKKIEFLQTKSLVSKSIQTDLFENTKIKSQKSIEQIELLDLEDLINRNEKIQQENYYIISERAKLLQENEHLLLQLKKLELEVDINKLKKSGGIISISPPTIRKEKYFDANSYITTENYLLNSGKKHEDNKTGSSSENSDRILNYVNYLSNFVVFIFYFFL